MKFFNLQVENKTMNEAVCEIKRIVSSPYFSAKKIYYLNPHCVNISYKDEHYRQALGRADLIYPDGSGISFAMRMLKSPMIENLNGTDMFPFLCAMCAESGFSMFLLGGKEGVAEQAAEMIRNRFQGIEICGAENGYFDKENGSSSVISRINEKSPDVLIVGLGVPEQELWIDRYADTIRSKAVFAVGGLLDFVSERIPRAPRWMRLLGCEWLFRLLQEPQRMWRRYIIGNAVFVWRVFKNKYFAGKKIIST